MTRLRRSDLTEGGVRRRRAGRGFVYLDPSGWRLDDSESLSRIRSLVVQPGWTYVWICPWPQGHIQAVGTDARARRQYLYHQRWRERRDKEKFDRVLEFGRKPPKLRVEVDWALALEGMRGEKVLACTLYLLDAGFLRIGGEEYAEDNGSYGPGQPGQTASPGGGRVGGIRVSSQVGPREDPIGS